MDFSRADLLDRRWHLRLQLLLDSLERDNLHRLRLLRHRQHCGALEYGSGQEVFDHHWTAANELLDDLRRDLFPWVKGGGNTKQDIAEGMRRQYIETFGDPRSPEAMEAHRRLFEAVQSGARLELVTTLAQPRLEVEEG